MLNALNWKLVYNDLELILEIIDCLNLNIFNPMKQSIEEIKEFNIFLFEFFKNFLNNINYLSIILKGNDDKILSAK